MSSLKHADGTENSPTIFLISFSFFSAVKAQKDSTHFVMTWQTDLAGFSNDSALVIGTNSLYTYNYDVDWDNDGIFDTLSVTSDLAIQYPSPGTYTIRIRGIFPAIDFAGSLVGSRDPKKILSINQWGTIAWATMYWAFIDCSNMVCSATDAPNLSNVSDISGMFRNATNFTGDLSNWDVSNISYMIGVFEEATQFNSDISNWNVSNVVNMGGLFHRAFSFNQDISSWDIQNVNSMVGIFQYSGISRTNYDQMLNSWQAKPHQLNVTVGAEGLTYCLGDSARNLLIADGWTFSGDSLDCLAIGLKENEIVSNIRFYPNPATSAITIESELPVSQINIYSMLGKLVKSSQLNVLYIEDFPKGNYIFEIVTKHGVKKELLVKE